jgi:hypothetical protein
MFTIESSYYFSLFIQAITLLIFYLTVSSIYYKPQFILLENAYFIEYVVSIIEFIGYIILGFYIGSKSNITTIRYLDWFITTNMLLVSLSLFSLFNNIYYDPKKSELEKYHQLKKFDFNFIKQEYGDIFLKIFTANTLMLIFGFLGELKFLNKYISLTIGLFFFTLSFKYIFDNFIQFNYINYITLSIFVFIWLLYAVAFLLDFNTKNIAYNLLDLISKNCFGIFLFFYLYYLNSL